MSSIVYRTTIKSLWFYQLSWVGSSIKMNEYERYLNETNGKHFIHIDSYGVMKKSNSF